ncbi:HlyD family efflux transporter periplasmic adaptor subunit [Streptomyces sp. NPDC021020]|uniref:HlyD family efflux transporter periplasmic adaptor subunit n=1 Tax=Streptomyces sp. NPDC021020 TaxID=3365109 RepID=UPI00379F7422
MPEHGREKGTAIDARQVPNGADAAESVTGAPRTEDGMPAAGAEREAVAEARAQERLASAARIAGERMALAPPGFLIALALVLAVVAGLVSWAAVGTVQSTVRLEGVLVHGDGPRPVASSVAGTVLSVAVAPGDAVRAGQQVAEVALAGGGTRAVRAPAAGNVLGIAAAPGTVLSPGTPVVALDSGAGGLRAWMFLGSDRGFPVAQGAAVSAQLSSDRSAVSVSGEVRSVGSYPITSADVSRMLGGLPASLAVRGQGPFRLVTVDLHAAQVAGAARILLDTGDVASQLPALVPVVARVRTGSVHPLDVLTGGSW